MKICIGIISYLPSDDKRQSRIDAIKELINKINEIFKDIPILIVTQNWNDFNINSNNKIIRFDYDKPLGILRARKILREKFLESEYDYLIMLDDDCKIIGNDGSDYIKEIKLHPNGFGWFSNHLLKLFAISKYVYSKIDLPNIDAEKLEGFEDKIFISMCRINFPDKEFEFDRSKLDEISYMDSNGPYSTWWDSEVSKHRKELRIKTTKFIEDYAKKAGVSFNIPEGVLNDDNIQRRKIQPVDIVVTYVNNRDKNWIDKFNKYKNETTKLGQTSGEIRFRDNINFIKYFLRSVDKNCNWVNKVFFVVQEKSQLPEWLDIKNKKLRVVYHDEYIPKELLPTFNSNVIEIFLPNIKDLSDNYILCNDDTLFFNPITRSKFFDGNIPVYAADTVVKRSVSHDQFMKTLLNNTKFIENNLNIKVTNDFRMWHVQAPHKKQIEKYILDNNYQKIIQCFNKSHFRDDNNITHWMYYDYIRHLWLYKKDISLRNDSLNVTLKSSLNFDRLNNKKLVCINDTENTDNYEYNSKRLISYLNSKFPEKCSYEIKNINEETTVNNEKDVKLVKNKKLNTIHYFTDYKI